MVKSFLPGMKTVKKRENARKTEILRAFGGRLTRRSHAPKPRALPTALHPENVKRRVCRKLPACKSRQAFRICLFILYHVCFKKSRFFGFFFCVGAVGTDGQKIRCFFCACLKGRENGEGGKGAREA